MAGQFSTAGSNIGLDAATGRVTQTARTTYLALLTSAPSDSTTMGTMAELTTPATNGYARQAVTWTAPAGDPASTENDGVVTFGPFSSDLANVTHCALVSASTGTSGDFIMYWTLDVAKDPGINDSIQVADAALVMTLD